jgi:SAM-dependent methyltransferase
MIGCKSTRLGAPARWYCCDVLDTPHELDNTADLVYTGRGALPWILDIQAGASVVVRLLKPDGRLYVFEGHPLDWVWDMEATTYQLSSRTGNYSSETVVTDRGWPLFSAAIQEHANKDQLHVHEHQWTLGEIMNSLVETGMRFERFEEHPDLFWNQFPHLHPELYGRLPHTFPYSCRRRRLYHNELQNYTLAVKSELTRPDRMLRDVPKPRQNGVASSRPCFATLIISRDLL